MTAEKKNDYAFHESVRGGLGDDLASLNVYAWARSDQVWFRLYARFGDLGAKLPAAEARQFGRHLIAAADALGLEGESTDQDQIECVLLVARKLHKSAEARGVTKPVLDRIDAAIRLLAGASSALTEEVTPCA